MTLRTPSFGLSCIDEVLLNCGLDRERRFNSIKFNQLIGSFEMIGLWNRNPELSSEPICVPLIPNPLHTIPCWGWHQELLGKLRTAGGKNSDMLVAPWVSAPSLQLEAIAKFQQLVYRFVSIPEARHFNKSRAVPRES